MTPRSLHLAQILWPAFLVAGVLEMVVFSWVDPSLLRIGHWHPDANTAYSVAFLVFWGLTALASYISHWLMSAQVSGSQELLAHRLES
jgi:hypothetical protein